MGGLDGKGERTIEQVFYLLLFWVLGLGFGKRLVWVWFGINGSLSTE